MQYDFKNPPVPPINPDAIQGYLVRANSVSGNIFLTEVMAPGIYALTSGSIHSNFVVSTAIQGCIDGTDVTICADVHLETTGTGAIGVTRVFSANNANFSTDAGIIAIDSVTAAIGRDLRVWSNTGTVYLSNLLQVRCMQM